MKEYNVIIYQESMLSSLFLGSAKVDPEKFSELLNTYAREKWRVVAIEKEMRRMLLFSRREAFIVILERDLV